MIHNVITAIAARLDEHIKNRLSLNEDAVIVSSLVDLKGNLNQDIENKITIFLLNIEEDKTSKNANMSSNAGLSRPVKISIHLMFSAHFPNFNYIEALKYISLVIEFFQANVSFNSGDTPGLPNSVSRINAELLNVSIEEIGKLWGNIGANYVPSVAYKFKHIHYSSDSINEDVATILGT
jgi:hypothetical protein